MASFFLVELDTTPPQVVISHPHWLDDRLAFSVANNEPLVMVQVDINVEVQGIEAEYDAVTHSIITSPWPPRTISGGTVALSYSDEVLNAGSALLDFSILDLVELVARFRVYSALRANMNVYSKLAGLIKTYARWLVKYISIRPED